MVIGFFALLNRRFEGFNLKNWSVVPTISLDCHFQGGCARIKSSVIPFCIHTCSPGLKISSCYRNNLSRVTLPASSKYFRPV